MHTWKKVLLTLAVALLGFTVVLGAPVAVRADTGTDWTAVHQDADRIYGQAQTIQFWAEAVRLDAMRIMTLESDPQVLALASQIVALAAQTERDAADIMGVAQQINYRIDHSEGTTLRLSDDIGIMADRIGIMANRILWTELQIGVMADRIMASNHLISYSSLVLSGRIKNTTDNMVTKTYEMQATLAHMQNTLR